MTKLLRDITILPIRLYRYCISPMLPPACRYVPTCSEYAAEAIMRHGLVRGGVYAVWRILRCNPLGRGGYDPVPPLEGVASCSHAGPCSREESISGGAVGHPARSGD